MYAKSKKLREIEKNITEIIGEYDIIEGDKKEIARKIILYFYHLKFEDDDFINQDNK